MKLSTLQNTHKYSVLVKNISQNIDISDFMENIELTFPNTKTISSMVATFSLNEKRIENDNEISIDILDEVGNSLYTFSGKAYINEISNLYLSRKEFKYEIKDSYDDLFKKVVPKTITYFDLYLCNTKDIENSLLHKIALHLGFSKDSLDFQDIKNKDNELFRIPFVAFRENNKWIDELQTFISAVNGYIYIENKKLIFRTKENEIVSSFEFNKNNLISRITESYKYFQHNGVKIDYDSFKRLENQVIFNLAEKIIVNENTTKDIDVDQMQIKFISDTAANISITKTKGYYFTSDDISSKKEIDLIENTHYVLKEFKESGIIVKFYNPMKYKLYITDFEIKGQPLVKYPNNKAIIKNPDVIEPSQENLSLISKNKYIQTKDLALKSALDFYKDNINTTTFSFFTPFIPGILLGKIYSLSLGEIQTKVRIEKMSISLKKGDFRIKYDGIEVKEIITNPIISLTNSLNPDSRYLELSNLKKELQDNSKNLEQMKNQLLSDLESPIKEIKGLIEQKAQVFVGVKPPLEKLSDKNIGDIFINPDTGTLETLIKKENSFIWIPSTDKEAIKNIKKYIKDNVENKLISITYGNTIPVNPNVGDIHVDLSEDGIWKRWSGKKWEQIDKPIRDAIKNTSEAISKAETLIEDINKELTNKLLAKAIIQETEPTSGVKEQDIWFNPKTNTFKIWFNNKWNIASEEDIMPSLKSYISLKKATLEIGEIANNANKKAGIFLRNKEQTFGVLNDIAEVSINKDASVVLKNANNLLQFNTKDPFNPRKMTSKILMGVSDVNDPKFKNVMFQIGDPSTGNYLSFKEQAFEQYLGGVEIKEKFNTLNNDISNATSSANTAKREVNKAIATAQSATNEATKAKTEAMGARGEAKSALNKINTGQFTINSNTKIVGMLQVFSDQGIESFNGTNESNSTKKTVLLGASLEYWEKE